MRASAIFLLVLFAEISRAKAKIQLKIFCVIGCKPITPSNVFGMQADCKGSPCAAIKPEWFKWTLTPEIAYEKDTLDGRFKSELTVRADVLRAGTNYSATVEIIEGPQKGKKADYKFETHSPPSIDNCRYTPRKGGKAILTQFTAECDYTPTTDIYFDVMIEDNDLMVIAGTSAKLSSVKFRVNRNQRVHCRITDKYGFTDAVFFHFKANSKDDVETFFGDVNNRQTADRRVEQYFFSNMKATNVYEQVKKKEYADALQIMEGFLTNSDFLTKYDLFPKYFPRVLKVIDSIPVESLELVKQISSVIAKICATAQDKKKLTLAFKLRASTICRNLGETMMHLMEQRKSDKFLSFHVADCVKSLSHCSQVALEKDEEALKVDEFPIRVPKPNVSVVDHDEGIAENYPDYVDDQKTAEIIPAFERIINNLIDMCYSSGQAKTMARAPTELNRKYTIRKLVMGLLNGRGRNSIRAKVESQDVRVQAPYDFAHKNEYVTIWVCTYTMSLFWWIKAVDASYTRPAVVHIVDENYEPLTHFDHPVRVSFNLRTDSNEKTKVVMSGEGQWPKQITEDLKLYRISLRTYMSYIIEFFDSKTADLEVLLTESRKPRVGDLKHVRNITDSKISAKNPNNFNSFHYVTVFSKTKAKYKFRVFTFGCYYWIKALRKWEYSNQPAMSYDAKTITCNLHHLSTVGGKSDNKDVVPEKDVIRVELSLESAKSTYIVLLCVAIVFLLYILLLIFFSLRKEQDKFIWFLSDVPVYSRYLYVVIVKTGNRTFAGTTSNVMVKLIGDKGDTTEHILNFPDPDLRLLQRNQEDWFALGVEKYLGDINSIQLRIDLVGARPSWYCKRVEVYDTINKKFWHFPVNRWFDAVRMKELKETFLITKSKISFLDRVQDEVHFWDLMVNLDWITNRKRITLCFSIILTMFFCNMVFYGLPNFRMNDCIDFTLSYGLNRHEIYLYGALSSLMSFFVHIWFGLFFRELRSPCNLMGRLKAGTGDKKELIIWCSIGTNIVVMMIVLITCGPSIPLMKSLYWATTCLFSLLIYIFLLENLLRLFAPFIYSLQRKMVTFFEVIASLMYVIERQRAFLYRTFGKFVIRPYIDFVYELPTEEQIEKDRKHQEYKSKLLQLLEDAVMTGIFITLLYVVLIYNTETLTCLNNKQVSDLVKEIRDTNEPKSFDEIYTIQDVINFINNSLIRTLQGNHWYGNYYTSNSAITSDFHKKYMGVVRIRQHRVVEGCCKVPETMAFVNMSCMGSYSDCPDFESYGLNWSDYRGIEQFARLGKSWFYAERPPGGPQSYKGLFGTYPGGGYIAKLGRNIGNSWRVMYYLMRNLWFDRATRSLQIEFLLYNVNNNLFDSVLIVFETTALGYVDKAVHIETGEILVTKKETVKTLLFYAFILVVFLIVVKLAIRFVYLKRIVFTDYWNFFDLIIVTLNCSTLILYVLQENLVNNYIETLRNAKNNDFMEYTTIFIYHNLISLNAALLICAATIRLWKLLRVVRIFRIMETTLQLSVRPLLALLVYELVLLFAVTISGYILYRDRSPYFQTFGDAFLTYLLISINLHKSFDYALFENLVEYLHHIVFMLASFVMMNLFIATICLCYWDAQQFHSKDTFKYSVKDYLIEQFIYILAFFYIPIPASFTKTRFKAASERLERIVNIEAKETEFRYANSYTVDSRRMDGMVCVAKSVLRNSNENRKMELSDDDFELMVRTAARGYRKDADERVVNKEVFFVSKEIEGRDRMRLVDDKKFQMMEEIARYAMDRDEARDHQRMLYLKIMNAHCDKMQFLGDYLENLRSVIENIHISNK